VRVHDHFSQIVFFSGNNKLRTEKLSTLKDGGIIKHKNDTLSEEKILVIVELDGDDGIDDAAWRRLFSAARGFLPGGSKIIITSSKVELFVSRSMLVLLQGACVWKHISSRPS